MKKLLILFFSASYVAPNLNVNVSNLKFNFDDNLSFDEFNQHLIQYTESSSYPNIDQ